MGIEKNLTVGTTVIYSTKYGLNPGRHRGRILEKNVPTGFHPMAGAGLLAGHYVVSIDDPAPYGRGGNETNIITDENIIEILSA